MGVWSAGSGRHTRAAYVFVGYTLFVVLVGSQLPTPLYRIFQAEFGFSELTLTAIYSVYLVAVIAGLLVFGPLTDAVGAWPALAAAIGLSAGGSLLFAVADTTALLYLARILQGLGVGAAIGPATAALTDLQPRGDRDRAALVVTLATTSGVAVGPLLAGVLVQYAKGAALPFLVDLALLVPACAAPVLLRVAAPPRRGRWRPSRLNRPAQGRMFAAATAAATVAWAVAGLFLSVVPSYLAALAETDNLVLLGGVVFLMLALSCAAQLAGGGIDPRPAQLAGLVAMVAGLVAVVLAFPARSLTVFVVGAVLAGLGHGCIWIGATSTVNRIAPDAQRAEVASTYFAVTYLVPAVLGIGVGVLADAVSLELAVYVFSGTAAVTALATIQLTRRALSPSSRR
jgi:MFS family permease